MDEMRLSEMLQIARRKNASDLHVMPGEIPRLRVNGELELAGEMLPARDVENMAARLLDDAAAQRLRECGDASVAWRHSLQGPLRLHAYRTARGTSFSVRLLAMSVPSLDSLSLPGAVATLAQRRNGLVLFTGPTGSGKTTALAALTDRMNRTQARHIITIEDPIEYEHVSHKSMISQREIGLHAVTFASALRGALRSDPDVIVLGEMRDPETMDAALTAAETGHLVFATLHTGDAPQTIDRIIDAFPGERQNQIRTQLSATLLGVVCLRLVSRASGAGRRAAAEILLANDAVRNLIRESKTHQIRNVIATSKLVGMQTLESHLSELVMRREITLETAKEAAEHPQDIRAMERSAS